MATTLQEQMVTRATGSGWQSLRSMSEQASEWLWCLLTFVFFVLLGPFSAPFVLLALFKLGLAENNHPEPEQYSKKYRCNPSTR